MLRRVITPAGRKDRLSLLYEYIKASYNNNEIDEWVLFKNADNINALHVHGGRSVEDIALEYGVSKNAMKKFMTDNKIL